MCLNGTVYLCPFIICLVCSNNGKCEGGVLLQGTGLSYCMPCDNYDDLSLLVCKLGVLGNCKVVTLSCVGLMVILGIVIDLLRGALVSLSG